MKCIQCGHSFEDDLGACPQCHLVVAAVDTQQETEDERGSVASEPIESESAGDSWQMNFDSACDAIGRSQFDVALMAISKAIVVAPVDQLASCHSTRGYIFLRLEQFERAEDDCSKAIDLDPADEEAFAWRGSARASLGKWREAVEDLQQAIQLATDNRAQYRQMQQSYVEQALEHFRQEVRDGRSKVETFYQRGCIYNIVGDEEKALRDFGSALQINPHHPDSLLGRARAMLGQQRYAEAVEDCTAVLAQENNCHHEALKLRARALEKRDDLPGALDDLTRLKQSQPNSASAYQDCGQIRFQIGDYVGAVEDLTHAIGLDAQLPAAHRTRGQAYMAMRNYDLAIADFTDSLQHVADEPQTRVLRGQAYLAKSQLKKALDDFNAALRADEINAEAYHGRAQVMAAQGKTESALQQCDRALRLDSRMAQVYTTRGRLYYEAKDPKRAIEEFTRGIQLDTGDRVTAENLYHRGVTYLETSRPDLALEDLDHAIRLRANHAGTYLWRANTYATIGKWPEAIRDLQSATQVNPSCASQYQALGNIVAKRGLEHFTSNIKANPDEAIYYRNRALALQFLNQLEDALADYDRALELQPDHPEALMGRGRTLIALGEYRQAAKCFSLLVDDDQMAAEALYHRATAKLEMRRLKEASRDIKHALKRNSRDPKFIVLRSSLLFHQRRFERAIKELTQAIAFDHTNYAAFDLRGQCHFGMGRLLEAINDFSHSLELNADQAIVITRRGEVYMKNGQLDRAMEDFEQAILRDRKQVRAYCGRALLMARRGHHERALIWLTKSFHRFESRQDWVRLLQTRGRIFYNMSRFGRAIVDYSTIVDLSDDPVNLASAFYARGITFLQKGDTKQAQEDFEQSRSADERYRPADLAIQWLQDRQQEIPAALKPPPDEIHPTRPQVVREPSHLETNEEDWYIHPPFDQWVVKVEDGTEFGPVPKVILDTWFRQGRINVTTKLLRADWSRWRNATAVYETLNPDGGRGAAQGASTETSLPDSNAPFAFLGPGNQASGNSGDDELPSLQL